MAPKIRGVVPPMKRYKEDDLGVLAPPKKTAVRHKGPEFGVQKFLKGDVVDVRLEESGLHGSWHSAVICGVKPGLRYVEFKNLFDSEDIPVREWVRFGNNAVGGKQPLGTRKIIDGKPVLRPGGPGLPPVEPSFRKTGGWPKDLWVEVFSEEAWWEGVLVEDISASQMAEENSVVDVVFPQLENLIEQVALKNLRECKVWNEETGVWSIRGRSGKANDPMRAMLSGEPIFEGVAMVENGSGAEDIDGMEGIGAENLISVGEDYRPLPKSISVVQDNQTGSEYFGRLIEVVEEEKRYLVRIQTLQYSLDRIEISVKEGFLSLDVTSEDTETKLGAFNSKVFNVCCAKLGFPTDLDVDYKNISWELHDEVLTVSVPWGGTEGKALGQSAPEVNH